MASVGGIHADYLVVGAGASGAGFVQALVDNADLSLVMVDRRCPLTSQRNQASLAG